jgi:hypothetical protein
MPATLFPSPSDAAPADTEITLVFAGKQLISVDANGDAPAVDADIHEIIRYISSRKAPAEARLAELEAGKALLLQKVNEYYDPLINQQKGILKWLTGQYSQVLESFTRAALVGQKTKSLRVGLLKLGLRMGRDSIKVNDEKTAIQWAKLVCPAAVKESLLKSEIPAGVALTAASGMERVEGEDTFYVS